MKRCENTICGAFFEPGHRRGQRYCSQKCQRSDERARQRAKARAKAADRLKARATEQESWMRRAGHLAEPSAFTRKAEPPKRVTADEYEAARANLRAKGILK